MPLEPLPLLGLSLPSVSAFKLFNERMLISSYPPDLIQVHPLERFGLLHSLALCYRQVSLVSSLHKQLAQLLTI